ALGDQLLSAAALAMLERRLKLRELRVAVESRVPNVGGASRCELAHRLAVAGGRRQRRLPSMPLAKAAVAAGDGEARRQPLDVPFERPGQRLVEVVDVEDKFSIGGSEDPEVGEIGVAA